MIGIENISDTTENTSNNIWSTEKVEWLMELVETGGKIPRGTRKPFYDGNPEWRQGNIVFNYTEGELKEIKRCAKDIIYFAEKYCVVMTDDGLQRIELREYQKNMLRHLVDNRFTVTLASRQIGKTICSAIFIAWYLLFNFDKNALVLANKGATTKEIIDKTKIIISHMPFFMKPGVLKNDVYEMKFDNGCRLVGQTTTGKAGIGFTIHLLFLDEFAHVHENFVRSFYENVYPTLSSSQVSRIVITSTPNGYNLFYNIYKGAVEEENEYKPFKVDWWEVPGRDEAWKQQETKNLGSEEAFNKQYGNQFLASSNLLLQSNTIKRISKNKKKYIYRHFDQFEDIDLDLERFLKFHPDFDIDDIRNKDRFFLFSIDSSDGTGGDAAVINIFEISVLDRGDFDRIVGPSAMKDFFGLKQVAKFASNEHSIEDFSKILYTLAIDIFYQENVKMVIEWNFKGALIKKHLETLFPQRNDFDESMICRFKHRIDAKLPKHGLKIKSDNKTVFCQNFKKFIEQRKFDITDEETVEQFKTFGKTRGGSYAAQLGHDDEAMSCINASEFFTTADFSDFVEEMLDIIPEETHSEIEEILYGENDSDANMEYDIYSLVCNN